MDKPKRLRREDPMRKGPIRNTSTYFRESNDWNEQASDSSQTHSEGQNPFDSLDEVVTNGVKLGYEVIEKYLQQGQKVAEGIHNGTSQNNSKEDHVQWLLTSMLRLNKDMAGFWIDAIETFVQNPDVLSDLLGGGSRSNGATPSSNGSMGANTNSTSARALVSIEIESSKRTRVTLDLQPSSTHSPPHVHVLNAPHSLGIPPLTDITFRWDPESSISIVELKIPDNQPSALYTGVVVDSKTNQARGTLSVQVIN